MPRMKRKATKAARTLLATFFVLINLGCTSTDRNNFNYGPADWLTEHGLGRWETMYSYQKFVEPKIRVHYVEDITKACGNFWAEGCSRTGEYVCDIWLGTNYRVATLDHEMRHCYGWDHNKLDRRAWAARQEDDAQRALTRSRHWYPATKRSGEIARVQ